MTRPTHDGDEARRPPFLDGALTGRRTAVVLTAVAVVGLVAVLYVFEGGQGAVAVPDPVLAPSSGAYLGAFVQPHPPTPEGEIAAFNSLEEEIGHSLEIAHVYDPWGSDFPTPADKYFVEHGKMLLLTWSGEVNTQAIVSGEDDAVIRARAEAIKALGRPILLEFRHEMDRPNLAAEVHGPSEFIAAWDHVRAIFASVGANNVDRVWCPTGTGFADGRAQAYYPGDGEVDWVCADIYAKSPSESLASAAAPFLHWAAGHDKPVIIGEFGVQKQSSGFASWLAAASQLPTKDHQIKAMVYFDASGINSSGNAFHLWLGDNTPALASFAGLAHDPYLQPAAPHVP